MRLLFITAIISGLYVIYDNEAFSGLVLCFFSLVGLVIIGIGKLFGRLDDDAAAQRAQGGGSAIDNAIDREMSKRE